MVSTVEAQVEQLLEEQLRGERVVDLLRVAAAANWRRQPWVRFFPPTRWEAVPPDAVIGPAPAAIDVDTEAAMGVLMRWVAEKRERV